MTLNDRSRWEEIEVIAHQARQLAKERLAELPIEFGIETDVRLLATVITGGGCRAGGESRTFRRALGGLS